MTNEACKIHLISMVRNEADIIPAFLTRATALFDKVFVIDHHSTDGTRLVLERFAAACDKIEIFNFRHRGYFQREISNRLARHAIKEGADWIFFLDADEFLDIDDRESLESLVRTFPHDVMQMRWMNLVPTAPGSFTRFDASQTFRWDGHPSMYSKIAMSATFAADHPDFFVHQGNHAVSHSRSQEAAPALEGCPILHVPIRALERLRYKLGITIRAHKARVGGNPTEGFHKRELHNRFEQGTVTAEWINGVITRYGEPLEGIQPPSTSGKGWTEKNIPGTAGLDMSASDFAASLAETLDSDARQSWSEFRAFDGEIVRADLRDHDVILRPDHMGSTWKALRGWLRRVAA